MSVLKLRMMEISLVDLLVYSVLISTVVSGNLLSCSSKHNCSECIQTSSCGWCSDPNYSKHDRCIIPSRNDCPEQYLINPGYEYQVLQNAEFSSENNIQMKPQKAKISVRVGDIVRIVMEYKQVTTVPIDLYYLKDVGESVEDNKQTLSRLRYLSSVLSEISTDVRIGFGTFAMSDAHNASNERLESSCEFHHHMSLTNDASKFSDILKESKVSRVYQFPKGLNAIIQAIECRAQIGWRKGAKRILIVSTDTYLNNDGNKKLSKNVVSSENNCNLSSDGSCSKLVSSTVEQISSSTSRNSINIIFAVAMPVLHKYMHLTNYIEGAIAVGRTDDSDNLMVVIKDMYNKISFLIELRHNASENININFVSNCTKSHRGLLDGKICSIKIGDVITYNIDIQLLKCPKNPDNYHETIQIYPVGFNANFVLDLEMICGCSCELPGHQGYQEYSPRCNNYGTYKCGGCECLPGYFGQRCECMGTNSTGCINPLNSEHECSGRGQCICGKCECLQNPYSTNTTYGQYCECDNFSCYRYSGLLCASHGVCQCGICICDPGWTGDSCNCKTSLDSCIFPGGTSESICSGHGNCVCGECECNSINEGRYSGKFCEKFSGNESTTPKYKMDILTLLL